MKLLISFQGKKNYVEVYQACLLISSFCLVSLFISLFKKREHMHKSPTKKTKLNMNIIKN